MLDCRHRLPCKKLCRNWGHSGVFWFVWQTSQCWWGLLQLLLCQLCCPSCHLVVCQDLSKSWNVHIYIACLARLKKVLTLLLLTLCLSTYSLSPQTWSSLDPFSSSEKPDCKISWRKPKNTWFPLLQVHSDISPFGQSTSTPISIVTIDCNIASSSSKSSQPVSH